MGKPSVNHGLVNQINSKRALPPDEPVGESNSYQIQSKDEREHLFHQEKPSFSFFCQRKILASSEITEAIVASYANLSRSCCCCCCFHLNNALIGKKGSAGHQMKEYILAEICSYLLQGFGLGEPWRLIEAQQLCWIFF